MRNVLVTGGAGFIGSNFIHYALLSEPNVRIINLDALTYAGSLENLRDLPDPDRYTFVKGDICDSSLVINLLQENKIDTIVHFAAESHVDRSILAPAQFIQTNIIGTFTLLEAARHFWLDEKALPQKSARFHHVSTDEVFGSLQIAQPSFSEKTAYTPNSPYSASKAASDHLVRAYFHTYGLPVTITNCSNNYGPRQFPEKMVPLMILNAQEGRPLPVYGDGKQVRDWLYVKDHCEAILKVIQEGKLGETYNVGGNNQPSNLDVIYLICKLLDKHYPESKHVPHDQFIQFVTDRPGHDRRYAMDIRKIQQELGWQPRESLETGMAKTIEWYLNHMEWVEAIRQRADFRGWLDKNYGERGAQIK
ncbi:MAG TPA: dTDP-glucose 4,6-dehydratase [Anaerolineaceae bacterium]|nr:dTDP-glucose 4,6-dehydratase [Anaerolineaceae bacterium]